MEIVGVNNWKLTCRREGDHVLLLRAQTCDLRAALPETVWDLPVTELGDHALAPGAGPAVGEEVRVICGPTGDEAAWDNGGLQELTLPSTLRRVGDYALFGCGALETLRLHDGVERWGGGVLMNCHVLRRICLSRRPGQAGETLAYFADELSRELDVTVTGDAPQTLRLLFPEYQESYEENCPAHHFDYCIDGAGYPYHHCFREKRLPVKEYDALWEPFLATGHDGACAVRLAFYRLRYPRDLSPGAERAYRGYLCAHTAEAVAWLLEEGDTRGLAFLLRCTAPVREELSAACEIARRKGAPEAVALLLEQLHRRFPAGAEKKFDL